MAIEQDKPDRDLFARNGDSTMMRTIVQLGGPLNKDDFGFEQQWTGVRKANEREEQLRFVREFLVKLSEQLWEMTKDERFEAFVASDLLKHNLYSELMWKDIFSAIYSTVFCFLFFILYLKSVFLALVATLIILFSFPLTALVVHGIFGVTYFGQMELLIYFVLLGITSDDIFVVIDFYRDSHNLVVKNRKQSLTIKQRMAYTIRNSYR
jgi:hypothetical protein